MAPAIQICIVPRTASLSPSEAAAVAAAIQQQIISDFYPIWQVAAIVSAAPDPLPGSVPIFVYDNIGQLGMAGYHTTETGNFPYAMVEYGPGWSITASHETLEILVDPTANRTWYGVLPPPNPHPVAFLYEICDPCQSPQYAYPVAGFYVSDFYTPDYCRGGIAIPGRAYSFRGNIQEPMSILPGGSLSWIDTDNNLYQAQNDGQQISLRNLGLFNAGPEALREFSGRFDEGYVLISRNMGPGGAIARDGFSTSAFIHSSRAHVERFDADLSRRFKGISI